MSHSCMTFFGIDPGKTGAVAAIICVDGEVEARVFDMPLDADDRVDATGIAVLLASNSVVPDRTMCCLEKAQAMPKQGVVGVFNYGIGYGAIRAALQIGMYPFQEITPMKWKKEFALIKKEKEDSVAVAHQLFPNAPLFRDKRGGGKVILHGRAEALLMAEYCRRRMG